MRPEILNPLFRPVSSLKGVGPKLGKAFERLLDPPDGGEPLIADLLFHLPTGIVDRRLRPGVARMPHGSVVTLTVRIDRHEPPRPGSRAPYKVFGHDETGEVALIYFHPRADWLEKQLPVGAVRHVSGLGEWFNARAQIAHPDYVVAEDDLASLPLVEPVYPLTEGVGQKSLARAVAAALAAVPVLPEWQDAAWLARQQWPGFREALADVHELRSAGLDGPGRSRLAYDELLASQVALALVRARQRKAVGRARPPNGRITEKLRTALPFALTGSQDTAIAEVAADLSAPHRMLRLLQGDVGSGKTMVALFAAAMTAEAGGQSALMAPTELLARQHYASIAPLAEIAGLRVALLTGKDRGRDRQAALAGLADGTIDVAIGTHALFQTGVAFADLALAVVDEQHRFGVHQRLALTSKGAGVDVLVMTATPIPRTLVLSLFGDMDVSRLTEKPAGRRPIDTRTVPFERMEELVERLAVATAEGQKAYWVCPLVEESELVDLSAAEERFTALKARFGGMVGLVHGRMSTAEKDAAMAAFRSGETRILVATTVIEVGVDVPDATIIVIEHAERFGLAQLHQLRGRVGRSDRASVCLLLYRGPLGETAKARLAVLRDSDDGFRIAEEDLKLRGEGELLGTRQSGSPGLRIADLALHAELVEAARDDARLILATDPELAGPRGQALRVLLHLFRRDAAVRLLRSG